MYHLSNVCSLEHTNNTVLYYNVMYLHTYMVKKINI